MRQSQSFAPLVCGVASAVFCAAIILIAPELVHAQGTPSNGASGCTCPQNREPDPTRPQPRPRFAEAEPAHDQSGEIATLEALHLALTEVGDGSSYVWHQRGGRLSGVIMPTTSFKDANGDICRHIVVSLTRANVSKRTEGVACRRAGGVWQLEG